MYKYINVFSISIFLMSLYILWASWSINKTKRNRILLGLLVTVISSKILCITMNEGAVNLNYIYKVMVVLLIIKINIRASQNKIPRALIFINYILGMINLSITIFYNTNIDTTLIGSYLLMSVLYLSFTVIYVKKLNVKEILLLTLIYLDLFTLILVKERVNYLYTNNIVDITISMYVFLSIFKVDIVDLNNRKLKMKSELNKASITKKINHGNLEVNRNISNMINESLSKKKILLKTIVDEYNICTFIIDSEGYILNEDNSFSKMWKKYSKYNYKINLNTFLNNNIKNTNDFIKSINKVKQDGVEVHGELRGKEGEFFECTYAPFIISNKNIGVICSMKDITYKKNSETKIKENNTKYRKIVDNIPYSILITDENNILYNNNKNEEIDFHNEEIKNIIVDTCTSGELNYTCKDHKEVCLNIDRVSFDDIESEKNLVVIRDITNYKKVLKDVEHSKEKYESLVNVIPEGIYLSNYDNKVITYSNKMFSRLIDKDGLSKTENNENGVITLGKNNDNFKFMRKVITNKYGETVNVESGEMLIEVNKKLKTVGIIRDITEQVKTEDIEREIEIKKKENKIKTEFFVNISHELKTPLNVISSSNQLLEIMNKDYISKNPDSEISKSIQIVKKTFIYANGVN